MINGKSKINPKMNLFDTYFKYVENTEPPLLFHRWSMITCVAAALGRQFRLPFGDTFIYPNHYCMLIGDPGTRKSTAIKTVKRLLGASGYTTFAAEKTSKEKFLVDLAGDADTLDSDDRDFLSDLTGKSGTPSELFIVADEFNEFVGPSNLEFLSLLGTLWDWDDENVPYKQRLKKSQSLNIYQPTLNILGGNTFDGFATAFPPEALGQGFLSRLILVHSEHSGKKFAFPVPPSQELKQELVEALTEIRMNVIGNATLTEKAMAMLKTIYHSYQGVDDVRLKHYSTRRHTHLLKLCLVVAASYGKTELTAEHVLIANSLLTYTEHRMPIALGEFGKSRNSAVTVKIINMLSAAKLPIEIPAIWRQVHSDLERPEDLNKLLLGLMQAGKIQYVHKTKYSEAQGYLIVRKVLDTKQVYVDYSLLKEAEGK